MQTLLLCRPDFYGIEYEINPWMNRARKVSPETSLAQSEGLRAQLEALGCEIEFIAPWQGLLDMVFTANAGLVVGRKFIRSNFRFPERRGEEGYFEEWFARRGYEVTHLPKGQFFEGEGDALFCGETLFCGHRFRSDIHSHRKLGEILDCLVVSAELVEERFYHLDTCFCPLGEGRAIWYPAAFDEYGQKAIRHHVPELIEVEPDEAMCFARNAVVVGKDVVLPEDAPRLCGVLRERGYRPHTLPVTEFIKAGGACKCLVLCLPQRSEVLSPESEVPPPAHSGLTTRDSHGAQDPSG